MVDGLIITGWKHAGIFLLQDSPVNLSTSLIQQQNDQIQRTLLFALIPVVVAFSFIVFVIYRARRELVFKRKEAELKLSVAESELKTLRAQMNPHFIFNCLNSIHHYMHSNNTQAAEYLIKFSQLIRHVLETSSQRLVLLSDEMEAVQNYIQLEQLRLNGSFLFEILVHPDVGKREIYIPPMLIQPFVENSIWHGLNQRGEGGVLKITLSLEGKDHLLCTIEDNGKEGHQKSALDLSRVVKKTSLGLSLIQERLQRLSYGHNGFEVEDIVDSLHQKCGKRIKLLLPFED